MKDKKMYNICFCTTLGWNPGDEIILMGIKNIFYEIIGRDRINPIIYNRNPDIRSQHPQYFKNIKIPEGFEENEELLYLEANVKVGMFDNSIKPAFDGSCIDFVVFAGTPEWCNGRCYDLYKMILDYNIPVMYLGVGLEARLYNKNYAEVIQKSKVFTVRDTSAYLTLEEQGFQSRYIPCPSLLSAPDKDEKKITNVKKAALIFVAASTQSVIWNGGSKELYEFELKLYRKIIQEYSQKIEIGMVCHYIDEVPVMEKEFPDVAHYYSYDAKDYMDIYGRFDLVIGARVHGIGCAASMLVPGIAIMHDSRGETCEGFLAKSIMCGEDFETSRKTIDDAIASIETLNDKLYYHKRITRKKYHDVIASALDDMTVAYEEKLQDMALHTDIASLCKKVRMKETIAELLSGDDVDTVCGSTISSSNSHSGLERSGNHGFDCKKEDLAKICKWKEILKQFVWRSWKDAENRDKDLNRRMDSFDARLSEQWDRIHNISRELKELERIRVKMGKLDDIYIELEKINCVQREMPERK